VNNECKDLQDQEDTFFDLSSLDEDGLLVSASISRPGFDYPTSHVSWLGKSIQVQQTQ